MAKIVHQNLAKRHGLVNTYLPYYQYKPSPVLESEDIKLYWNRSVITDRLITANRPDVIIVNKQQKVTFLIDIAIPNTHNMNETHTSKITKYLPLAEEERHMWGQERVTIVPVVLSSTGVVPNTLTDALGKLGISLDVIGLMQKAVILETCSIVRSFLNLPV